jgi:SAM-dependent methyltransferase
MEKTLPKKCRILDACAGTGIYAFALAEKGHEVVAGDLLGVNVDQMRKRQAENHLLEQIYAGNILDLSQFEGGSFDAVLNLGAYYHQCDREEREKGIKESLRVLKDGGIIVIAYINRYANYYGHGSEMLKNFEIFEYYMEHGHLPGNELFYATTPALFKNEIQKFNLTELYNVASDGPLFCMRDTLQKMDDATLMRYIDMHISHSPDASILGMSEHCMYIRRK